MKKIDKVFLNICKRFNDRGVKYVVCGAYACKLHGIEEISGQERLTVDYDFIVDTSEENIKRLKDAISDINPEVKDLKDDDLKNYQTIKVAGKREIDLISSLWQLDYAQAIQDMMVEEVESIKIPVLSIDKLIETKKNSFRERDQADTYWLTKLKNQKKKR